VKEFNYCIGHTWGKPDGAGIGVYTFGSEVHFGTLKSAEKLLKYVKKQSPEWDWKIHMVVPIPIK
jgi:hypothetical protein